MSLPLPSTPQPESNSEAREVVRNSVPKTLPANMPTTTTDSTGISALPPKTPPTSMTSIVDGNRTEEEDEVSKEIIKSPLDQREYKYITLPNGIRVMLISTYNVEIDPDEQDTTQSPCQIPEVTEFNKTYLGYNNPIAKVRCQCPCDDKKACCCGTTEEDCKTTESEVSALRQQCCQVPPPPEEITPGDDLEAQSKEKKAGSLSHGKNPALAAHQEEPPSQEFSRGPRTYPNPPKYSWGTKTHRFYPNGNARGKSTRPNLSHESKPDLEGNIFLVIGSGYFDDPEDQPGLAHFCEHAVFLGSSKFPEPNQLFKLILPYNGYVNAYTSGMMTTFAVSSSHLLFPLAVDILADMVGFPLFPNSLVAAEMEAVDSEYSLRQDDTPKYFQLIASLSKKGHVMRKMDSGNLSTLSVPNFFRRLQEWKKIYYNPCRMTLAVEAPYPLDALQSLVTSTFGNIPPSPIMTLPTPRHSLSTSPFDVKRFHQIYHVPSVYHSEFIALHWSLDHKCWKHLTSKPLEYLGSIFSHRGPGGLYSYLSNAGLCTNIEAGCWESDVTRNHFTSVFCVSVDMTEEGFKQQDTILQAIFGYITFLMSSKPSKTFFQELQKQQLDVFHFHAAENTISTAEGIARWMQFIPPEWSLISPSITPDFDPALIQKYTELLTIETCNVIIFSKNYGGISNQSMEEFYNTPYAAFNFPDELIAKISRTKEAFSQKYTLPTPNQFLTYTSCHRARDKDLLSKGQLERISGKLSVTFVTRTAPSVRGFLPQARYSIWIGSPLASYMGAQEGSSTKMLVWAIYMNEIFERKFFHATAVGIQVEAEISQGELHISLCGPGRMLADMFEEIVFLIANFEKCIDPVGFEVVKSGFIEDLDNTILDNRFLAWDLFYYLWTNNHDLIFDHRRNAEEMTFTQFLSFVTEFKKQMYIQCHLYGYVTKVHGKRVVSAIKAIKYEAIALRQYLTTRCIKLPLGERIVKLRSQNPNIHTSVIINSYQFGILSEAEEEVVDFFAKTMSDAAFYQLRTEQQLGYIIIIYPEITYKVSSIIVELVTQPKNFTTDYCNQRIDEFLASFFEKNLSTQELFTEFCLGKPKLDLSYNLIRNLFMAFLLPNPVTYRKLSIQIVGDVEDAITQEKAEAGYQKTAPQQERKEEEQSPQKPKHESLPMPPVKATAAPSIIAQVRAARAASLGEKIKETKKKADSSAFVSKPIEDLAKFKRSLTFFSKDPKQT